MSEMGKCGESGHDAEGARGTLEVTAGGKSLVHSLGY
jgi:hypothetical protein